MPKPTWLTTVVYSSKRLDQPVHAQQLLNTICRYDTFVPDRYDWCEPIRQQFDKNDLRGPVAVLENQEDNKLHPEDPRGGILLSRRRRPRCSFNIEWSGIRLEPITASFYNVEEEYVHEPARLAQWLDFSLSLFIAQDAWYGAIALDEEHQRKHKLVYSMPASAPPVWSPGATVETYVGTKLYENIPGVYWGNYFGPFYVEWLGRHRFSTVPCVDKRWLPNGGVFITTASLPSEWSHPAAQTLQGQLREHLGADAFFDIEEVRRTFLQRLGKDSVFEPNQIIGRCRLPEFPFAGTYRARLAEVELVRRERIILDQAKRGFQFVGESEPRVLVFQSKTDDTRVIINQNQRALSIWPERNEPDS